VTRAVVWPAAAVTVALMLLGACAFLQYAGSGFVFFVFNLSFFALAVLAFPRPRLYVYTFLAAFMILGFWAKVVIHAIWAPDFVEPVGGFSNTPAEWDSALLVATCGAIGVMAARLTQLVSYARKSRRPEGDFVGVVPAWFTRREKAVWAVTMFLIIAVNAANLEFAFFQVGVRPKLLLPMWGHVLLAWLVNIGLALWVATLVWWNYLRRRAIGRNLLLPIGESLLSATSAFSRLNFLLHSVPYVVAILERNDLLAAIRRRSRYSLLATFLVVLLASVVTVFGLRVYQYYGYAAGTAGDEPLASHVARTVYKQVPLLLIHRWIGLEGVLAVGATAGRSPKLLLDAISESPRLEDRSLFQRAAGTHYLSEKPQEFIFMSNAGPLAVLWFSGSLALVLLGMAVVGVVLMATEEVAGRATGNPFLLAVSGAALANVTMQTTFFYLTFIFLLQLWMAIGVLAVLQRVDVRNSQKG
jgi:hypothetical protein